MPPAWHLPCSACLGSAQQPALPSLPVYTIDRALLPHAPAHSHRQFYGEQGALDDTPLPVALERQKDPHLAASPLRFPGAALRSGAGRPG